MKKIVLMLVIFVSSSSYSSGYFMFDLGVDYARQLSTSKLQGLDEFVINTTLFGRITNNLAWEVYLKTHLYGISYTLTQTYYKHTSLAYGLGLRFYIIDGLYIKAVAGGFRDYSDDADAGISDTQWTFGGGIGYVIPFPFLTWAKPFVNIRYHKLYKDKYDMFYFGGGFVLIIY